MSSHVPAFLHRRISATARIRGAHSCTAQALFALLGTGSAHADSSGSLRAKYALATTNQFGYVDSHGSGYLDLPATQAIAPGWALAAHAGKQWIEGNDAFAYSDWKLGVTRSFDHGASLGLAWTGTDADVALYTNPHGRRLARSTVALTLAQAF